MQLPHRPKSDVEGNPQNGSGLPAGIIGGLLVLAAVSAWIYPAAKPNAVLGCLNYFQFWSATVLTVVAALFVGSRMLPRGLRRAVAFRVIAVTLSLVVAVLAVELVAYLLPVRHQMDNPWYLAAGGGTSDSVDLPFERPPHLKWEGLSRGDLALLNGDPDPYARPVTFETDWEGFRNSRDVPEAELVTIGDSFAEAGNVMEAESFPRLAGERLGVSNRNLGRAGYTAATELIVLKKYGLKCRPKTVVWQIAEANDLAEMVVYEKWVSFGRPRYFDAKPDSARREGWERRSPTFRLFNALRESSPRPWPLEGTFRDDAGVVHPVRFLSAPGLEPPVRGHPGWPAFSAALLDGAVLCRTNNIRLLVLLIPSKERVMAQFTKLNESATAAFDRPEGESMGAVMEKFCRTQGIAFIDATTALRAQAAAGKLVYLPYDTHLSPLGHQIVAELVVSKLSE
jgi:hypothetical protein